MSPPNHNNRPEHTHALVLLRISLASTWRRLRHDLGTEIVVAICVAVLLATFFYIFNDFINTQVASLSEPMKVSLAEWFSRLLLLACGAWGGGGYGREQRDPDGIHGLAVRMGEYLSIARLYLVGRRFIWFILFVGTAWITLGYLFPPASVTAVGVRLLFALAGWTIGRMTGGTAQSGTEYRIPSVVPMSMIKALAQWRLLQMKRNTATKTLFYIGVGFAFLAAMVAARSGPDFVVVLSCFAGGFCAAAAIPVQVQEDLNHAWVEKTAGVSHDSYMGAIKRVSLIIGIFCALAAVVTVGLTLAIFGGPIKLVLVAAAVAAVPAWSMPAIIFQIDARRSAATILAALIVTLFLATAVYAHWLSLLLLPIMSWYGSNMQARRFHRA